MKDSLHLRTAKLPDVDIRKPASVLGRDTTRSIQSGLYYASVGGLRYIIERVRTEHAPAAKVVATGGLSALLRDDLAVVDLIDPDLTLRGLNFLFQLNNVDQ
jgi:type III pantothenate kinase